MSSLRLTPGAIATLACCLEVAAPKPGNVHRGADFEDLKLEDLLTSGLILGQVIDQHPTATVGETILQAVQATQASVGTNSNLGIILLLVPLAKAMKAASNDDANRLNAASINAVFDQLDQQDTAAVFQAIRLANPGGLGVVGDADVNRAGSEIGTDLVEAMRQVANVDLVARQYVERFQDLMSDALPVLLLARKTFGSLSQAIVYLHLHLMARYPDGLIWRKCGEKVARQSQMLAAKIVDRFPLSIWHPSSDSSQPQTAVKTGISDNANVQPSEPFWSEVADLDFWLRSDGHRRNPGTTADLVTACLFLGIARGDLAAPFR